MKFFSSNQIWRVLQNKDFFCAKSRNANVVKFRILGVYNTTHLEKQTMNLNRSK